MALTFIALVGSGARGANGNPLPVVDSVPDLVMAVTPTGSTEVVNIAATSEWSVWDVTTDVSIYIAFGVSPEAGADKKGFLMLAGSQRNFAARSGHKPAVKLV